MVATEGPPYRFCGSRFSVLSLGWFMLARSTTPRAPLGLKIGVGAVLLFLYFPFTVIMLYAFSTEDATFTFPPPGLTIRWFGVAWGRADVWRALLLSLRVAAISTTIALVLG